MFKWLISLFNSKPEETIEDKALNRDFDEDELNATRNPEIAPDMKNNDSSDPHPHTSQDTYTENNTA